MSNHLTKHSSTAVAVGGYDPFAALASTLSAPGMDGAILKFSKGRWFTGRANEETEVTGKVLVADLDNLQIGWRKWVDKRIADQHIGLVADGFRPPQRNDLDALDESEWERDANGNPKDPWSFGIYLRLIDAETGEAFVWTATSHGAKGAVGTLVQAFAKKRKDDPQSCTPVVKLASDYYRHKSYGRVDTPLLEIVDWKATETAPAIPSPDGSDDANLDDTIPF